MLDDARAFVGLDGGRAAAIADRMLGSAPAQAAARAATTVRAGIEVRSSTDLTLSSDLHLGLGLSALDAAVASSRLPALTLRAAGALNLSHSLTTGLDQAAGAAAGSLPTQPLAADAGALRLVAGADLSAALPTAVLPRGSGGSLTIGRAAPDNFSATPRVVVADSTGRIDLAAAGNVTLLNAQASVFTTGREQTPGDAALAARVQDAFRDSDGRLLGGGGALTVRAGGDVSGQPGADFITDWWWRTEQGGWYARFAEAFRTGMATFGGGDVTVSAGGSIRMVDAVAANSGVAALPEGGAAAEAVVAGGGSVRLRAGADIDSSLASASGAVLSVQAGGSIGSAAGAGAYNGLQVDHQATQVRIEAGGSVGIGAVRSAGLIEASRDNTNASAVGGKVITGLDGGAALAIYAWSGDLAYAGRRSDSSGAHNGDAGLASVVPADAVFAAPLGSLTLGDANAGIAQRPVDGGRLQILAGRALRLGEVLVQPPAAADALQLRDLSGLPLGDLSLPSIGEGGVASVQAPVQVVAQSGDLNLVGALRSARPARMIAGGDLALSERGSLLLVHPGDASSLSLLQAGRDIAVGSAQAFAAGTLELRGAGDLVLLAGRGVDLGHSAGVVTRGNLDDSLGLASGGANVTVVAGLSANDLAQANRRGFALVGGAVAAHPDALAGLLTLAQAGGGAAQVGHALDAATAFAALAPPAQLDQARSLLGGSAADAALLAAVRAVTGQAGLDRPEAARLAFDGLAPLDQKRVVGQVMATGFDALPAELRQQWLLALSRSGEVPGTYGPRLSAFVAQHSGSTPADAAAALSAFTALAPEQQWLLSAQVLRDELRASGRAAAGVPSGAFAQAAQTHAVDAAYRGITGGGEPPAAPPPAEPVVADRNTAYAHGYASIDTLFPGLRSAGDVGMTTSQVKTQQGGDITLLTPGGGINAGALASAGTVDANRQGIVTVAGGDITAVVRNDFAVNQSRVFTLARGDLMLWSSEGNLDAGRGAKTVRGAPRPVYGLDRNGNVTVDTSGSFTGSGIAVLDSGSALDLFAPKGEINAGDAGIVSRGQTTLAAERVINADALKLSGQTTGAPPPPPEAGATAGLGALAPAKTAAAPSDTTSDDKDDERRKKRRRNLFLDFLGFGPGG